VQATSLGTTETRIRKVTNNIKAGLVFEALGLRTEDQCPIQSHICDMMEDGEYNDVKSLVADLQQAHWSAGSFNLIYNWEIEDALNRLEWRKAIDKALEDYQDATGETFGISTLSDALTMALDWVSNDLSHLVESVRYWLVTEAVDSMDPWPDQYLFTTEWEALDHVSEGIQTRVDYLVQHSQHSVSEGELEALQEQEAQLFTVKEV
jgi:hypothetical protein